MLLAAPDLNDQTICKCADIRSIHRRLGSWRSCGLVAARNVSCCCLLCLLNSRLLISGRIGTTCTSTAYIVHWMPCMKFLQQMPELRVVRAIAT